MSIILNRRREQWIGSMWDLTTSLFQNRCLIWCMIFPAWPKFLTASNTNINQSQLMQIEIGAPFPVSLSLSSIWDIIGVDQERENFRSLLKPCLCVGEPCWRSLSSVTAGTFSFSFFFILFGGSFSVSNLHSSFPVFNFS